MKLQVQQGHWREIQAHETSIGDAKAERDRRMAMIESQVTQVREKLASNVAALQGAASDAGDAEAIAAAGRDEPDPELRVMLEKIKRGELASERDKLRSTLTKEQKYLRAEEYKFVDLAESVKADADTTVKHLEDQIQILRQDIAKLDQGQLDV